LFRAANVIEATGRIEREIPEMRIKNPQYCEVYEVKNYLEFFRERLDYIGRVYLAEDNKKLRDVYVSKLRPQITSQYVREAKPQNIIIATEKAVEHAKIIAPIFKTMHVLPGMKRGNKDTPNMFSNIGKRKFDHSSDNRSENKFKKSKPVEKPYCSYCKARGHYVDRCNNYPDSTIDKNQREAHLFCKNAGQVITLGIVLWILILTIRVNMTYQSLKILVHYLKRISILAHMYLSLILLAKDMITKERRILSTIISCVIELFSMIKWSWTMKMRTMKIVIHYH
jgi:hypothetical protein